MVQDPGLICPNMVWFAHNSTMALCLRMGKPEPCKNLFSWTKWGKVYASVSFAVPPTVTPLFLGSRFASSIFFLSMTLKFDRIKKESRQKQRARQINTIREGEEELEGIRELYDILAIFDPGCAWIPWEFSSSGVNPFSFLLKLGFCFLELKEHSTFNIPFPLDFHSDQDQP